MRGLGAIVLLLAVACSGARYDQSIRGCPRPDWPGPWTACAEARWVAQVVEAGGYDVGDGTGTGSALIAAGRGRAFYVWAGATGAGDSEPSDDGVHTSWTAQGYTFWVGAGPRYTDAKPTVAELRAVAAASRLIPPPPEE